MEESILTSTKTLVGIGPADDSFDLDVCTYINSAFSTLSDLGIGPSAGFMIQDAEPTWSDFLDDDIHLNMVKNYVTLRVRMIFDPPPTSFAIAAFEKQILELEWRINVYRENLLAGQDTPDTPPVDPDPPNAEDGADDGVVDGISLDLIYQNAKV